MTEVVPSWILKGGRAEKHLHDLKLLIAAWADPHPYEVAIRSEGKKDVYRLHFTSTPGPDMTMIVADFVYNLRSGLDHLMAALVPRKQRGSVYFPIYFPGVWDPSVPGEDPERAKARGRWASDTKKLRPEALAILKSLQPVDGAREDNDPEINAFLLLNRISNRDRHHKLPVSVPALKGVRLIWTDPAGNRQIMAPDGVGDSDVVEDEAEVRFPGAVDVGIVGAPTVGIKIPSPKANVEIPSGFDQILTGYRTRAVDPLSPYVLPL